MPKPSAHSIWRPFRLFPTDKEQAYNRSVNTNLSAEERDAAKKALSEGGWYGNTCRKTLDNGKHYNYAILIGQTHGPECVESCEKGIVDSNGKTEVSITDAVYVDDPTYEYVMLHALCATTCPIGTIMHQTTRKCLDTC